MKKSVSPNLKIYPKTTSFCSVWVILKYSIIQQVYPHNFRFLPAALAARSPSTKTHQPSPPTVPPSSPPTPPSNSLRAYPNISSSYVPGCNHTLLTPKAFASSKTFRVTFGGVIIETPVSLGLGRAERDGRVGYSVRPTLMAGEEGLMGVAGRPRAVYHAKTTRRGD